MNAVDGAKVRLFAHGRAKPEQAAALRALMVEALRNARGERGLEIYEAFETVDGQEFILNEQYADQEALDQHMSTERFKEIMTAASRLVDGEIRIWRVKQIT